MSQVACMRAVAKVAWEVFDGVCGGRRRNVETEGKESSDEASNNVEVCRFMILQRVFEGNGLVVLLFAVRTW